MGIPPQAARIIGAWPEQTTQPTQPTQPTPRIRQSRRDRSRRLTVARILHPLHQPVPSTRSARAEAPSPLGAKPARHA